MDVQSFVRTYTAPSEAFIRFDWNGQYADKLLDKNLSFRKRVLEEVLGVLDTAPILLIRDLFEAETCFAQKAWGVDIRIRHLARALLTRGGAAFVEDFFRGKYRGQDAYMAAGAYPELASLLLDEINKRLASNSSGKRRRLLKIAKEDCERWLSA